MKKVFKWIGIVVLFIAIVVGSFYLVYVRPFMQKMKVTTTVPYDKDLTIILGGGGNSGILVSDSLVIVIDTKMDEAAERLADTVKKLAGTKPILVINTHYHPDHSKGNKYYAGATILAGGNYNEVMWAKEASKETMPNKWLKGRMDIKMGDDTVTILNFGKNAHTQSDVFVYLHRRKLLFGGDVILNKQTPVLMGAADASGYLEAYNELPKEFDIKTIVPGHGPIGGIEVINNMKQFFNDMKLAATDGSKKDELVAKYKDWGQLPFFMSPGATISYFKKHPEK